MRSSGDGRSKQYEAVLARAGGEDKVVQKEAEDSTGVGSGARTKPDKPEVVRVLGANEAAPTETGQTRTKQDNSAVLSVAHSFHGNGSGQTGQESGAIFTREERPPEELLRLMQEASRTWE